MAYNETQQKKESKPSRLLICDTSEILRDKPADAYRVISDTSSI